MTAIPMRRQVIDDLLVQKSISFSHAGLWLSCGLQQLDGDDPKLKQQHIQTATEIPVSEIYQAAYKRWQGVIANHPDTIATWCGKLDGRLFIGTGGASVLEAAITLSRTYGVPVIPGSAVKGLVRAYVIAARNAQLDDALDAEQCAFLFGYSNDDEAESGAVIFHDAWWIPQGEQKPLVAEVVTVHHPEYYARKQDKTTDFDSPTPAPQIAAQGSFLFAVECGDKVWAAYARDVLVEALQHWGIGGKTAAGYGRFVEDEEYLVELADAAEQQRLVEEQARREEEDKKLSPQQRRLRDLREKSKHMPMTEKTGGDLSHFLAEIMREAESDDWLAEDKKALADIAEGIFNQRKWWGKKKQEKKARIAKLRG